MPYIKIEDRAKALGIDYSHEIDGQGSGFYCLCGCEEATRWNGKKWVDFRPGHDARLVGRLLRGCRDGSININEAVEVLELVTDSDRLANKLRGLFLRVGRTITPKIAALHGRKVVCTVAPYVDVEAEYAPRHKTDSEPWRVGILRYNHHQVRIAD